MKQRSPEWYDMRRGKFTASEIHRLLGREGLKTSQESFELYCEEKANEMVFGINEEEEFLSADVRRGIELEPLAFGKFKEIKYMDFIDVQGAFFYPYKGDSGASPDGLVGSDAVLEIKCPRPDKFFRIIRRGISAIDAKWLDQVQHQMLCTNSKRAHFFFYIIFNGREMWHEIVIERDEERIELIKERIEKAIKVRNDFAQYLIENNQFSEKADYIDVITDAV